MGLVKRKKKDLCEEGVKKNGLCLLLSILYPNDFPILSLDYYHKRQYLGTEIFFKVTKSNSNLKNRIR